MDIIIPAAGLSSRFPNMRPKYTLTGHDGKIMVYSAVEPFVDKHTIHIGILKKHDDQYDIKNLLGHEFDNKINVVVLEEETAGPADTVYQIIKKSKINLSNEIFVKDCDSFFDHTYQAGNYVCVTRFSDNGLVKCPSGKSYITTNDQGIIQNIVEKQIISDKFCVGGYKFESAELFCKSFESLSQHTNEVFVSNIIQYALNDDNVFLEKVVTNYTDVGTAEEWFDYNNKSVIFCDIDGTIIKAQSKNAYNKNPVALEENVSVIKSKIKKGDQVFFVTSRPESCRKETEKALACLGLENYALIMGLKNVKRVLINDFNDANPYPRAVAVNLLRNSDSLRYFL